jgi:hypothetical protein
MLSVVVSFGDKLLLRLAQLSKKKESRRRHENAIRRRTDKNRERKASKLGKASLRHARPSSDGPVLDDMHPLRFMAPYQSGRSVFGVPIPAEVLIARIQRCDWRESLVRIANLAALVANDENGAVQTRSLQLTQASLLNVTKDLPGAQAMLKHAQQRVRAQGLPFVVTHEEGLMFLEHLILLHGGTGGGIPDDGELSLWLLAAADHLDAWLEPEPRELSQTEVRAAEVVKVARFNRSSVDDVRLALRAEELFNRPPRQGPFSSQEAFSELQKASFGEPFLQYYDSFVLPLHWLSHAWGSQQKGLPVYARSTLEKTFGSRFLAHLEQLTGTREELRADIQKRMRSDSILPHAPTALLRKPFIDLENGEVLASSPWFVRSIIRTGIWAKYLSGAKKQLGERGGEEWTIAFGHMLEEWCRQYALRAQASAQIPIRIDLPSEPGAPDEIEDVVLIEDVGTILFSIKGRLVREDIARHALSKAKLIGWYDEYFFKAKTGKFRAGVVAQLNSHIDRIRAGEFEPRVIRDAAIYPVVVTYDQLGANMMLYEWLVQRCKQVRAYPTTSCPQIPRPQTDLRHAASYYVRAAFHCCGSSSSMRLCGQSRLSLSKTSRR